MTSSFNISSKRQPLHPIDVEICKCYLSFNSLPGQFQEIKESLLVMIQNLFTIKMWQDWIGNLLHKSPAMVSEIFLIWFLEFNITNKAK